MTDTFEAAGESDSVLPLSHDRLKCVRAYVHVWVVWHICFDGYPYLQNFKLKMNVTLCLTINDFTDRLAGEF